LTSRDGLKSINNSINIIIIIIGDYYTTALNALLLFFDALLLVIIKYSFFSFRIFLLLLAKYAFPHERTAFVTSRDKHDHRLQIATTTTHRDFVLAKSIENNAKNTPIKKTTKIQWCSNTTFGSRFRGKW
jgi:hypothetical protein